LSAKAQLEVPKSFAPGRVLLFFLGHGLLRGSGLGKVWVQLCILLRVHAAEDGVVEAIDQIPDARINPVPRQFTQANDPAQGACTPQKTLVAKSVLQLVSMLNGRSIGRNGAR